MAWRLLIVEDDASLRRMLAWDLDELGYRVTTAGGCREAMGLARRQGFDLALIDYQLPDGDGIGLTEHLRATAPDLLVFLYTGSPSAELVARALRNGARDLLVKPVGASLLDAQFRAALDRNTPVVKSPRPG